MTFLLQLSRLDRNLIVAVVVIAYGIYAVRIGAAVISNHVDPSLCNSPVTVPSGGCEDDENAVAPAEEDDEVVANRKAGFSPRNTAPNQDPPGFYYLIYKHFY